MTNLEIKIGSGTGEPLTAQNLHKRWWWRVGQVAIVIFGIFIAITMYSLVADNASYAMENYDAVTAPWYYDPINVLLATVASYAAAVFVLRSIVKYITVGKFI